MEPIVSIVIPTLNRQEVLGRALNSVLNQTFEQWELIVVDGGSTDNTVDFVRTNYQRMRLIELEENRGAAAARNAGVSVATGKYIAFLDSDDEWHSNYLRRMVDVLESKPDCPIAYSGYISFLNGEEVKRSIPKPSESNQVLSMLLKEAFIQTMSLVVIRKSTFDIVGLFEETLRSYHDIELYLRILHLVGDAITVEDYLVNKHWLQDSILTGSDWQARARYGKAGIELFYQLPGTEKYENVRSRAVQMRTLVSQNLHKIFSKQW